MIEVRNLTKSYQIGDLTLPVLKGISFTVTDSELCAIMGPSGSGKSTLMNILGCLDTPTGGDYFLDGEHVATFDEARLTAVWNPVIPFPGTESTVAYGAMDRPLSLGRFSDILGT